MKLKKRRKSSRRRGTRLCGWAAKKHKGKGNRGGMGMCGSGKHKKTYVIKYMWPYFGRAASKMEETVKNFEVINVGDIEESLENFKKQGIAKEGKEGTEITLKGYKVLGDGDITKKFIVKAIGFTNSAKVKIEKAGGQALVLKTEKKEKPKEKKEPKAEAKKVEKKPEVKKHAEKKKAK